MARKDVTPREAEWGRLQEIADREGVPAMREAFVQRAMRGEAIGDVEAQFLDVPTDAKYGIKVEVHYDNDDPSPTLKVSSTLSDDTRVQMDLTLGDEEQVEITGQLQVSFTGPLTRARITSKIDVEGFMGELGDELSRPSILWAAGPEWYQPALDLGGRGQKPTDAEAARWAYLYTEAMKVDARAPHRVLCEWFPEVNPNQSKQRVWRARERTLLTKPQGSNTSGGKLTAKAHRLLKKYPYLKEMPDGVD